MNKIKLLNQSGMTMVNDYKDEMPVELFRNKYSPEMYFDDSELFVTEYQYIKPILELPRNEAQAATVFARNGEALHRALRHLPNSILLNERFWLWLSLVEYHEFVAKSMRANRGSVTQAQSRFDNTVLLGKERLTTNYLFSMFWLTDRAAVTIEGYDYSRIKVVFEHISNFKQFIKLPFANSDLLVESFVDFMHLPKYSNLNSTFYNEFLKMLNEVAGLLLLDSFDRDELGMLMKQIAEDIVSDPKFIASSEEEVKPKAKAKSKPKKKKKAAAKPKVVKETVVEEEVVEDEVVEEDSAPEEDYYEEEVADEPEEEPVPKDDLDALLERQREAQAEREEKDREEEWRRNNLNNKKDSFLDED